ncbi:hypothetical protein Hanom_Chr01g00086981 [Helianthus anomalus]
MEVCATGCSYFITFFIALRVENRMLLLFNLFDFFLFCFLSFKCYVVQGLAYLIRVYTSISSWFQLMVVWVLEVKGLDSEHNQAKRSPQTPGEAKKSNNEVQQKEDNNPNSVADKLSGKCLVKPKRTI